MAAKKTKTIKKNKKKSTKGTASPSKKTAREKAASSQKKKTAAKAKKKPPPKTKKKGASTAKKKGASTAKKKATAAKTKSAVKKGKPSVRGTFAPTAISFAEARRIVTAEIQAPAAREAALARLDASATLFPHVGLVRGDTALAAGLAIGAVVLVVGNLEVQGLVDDGHDVDDTLLIVTGSLHCAHLVTLSAMVLGGDCTVEGICFGDSLGDDALIVGGTLRTRLLVDHRHAFHVGALEAGIVAANSEGPHVTASIDRVLAADLLHDGDVDIALLVERLESGGHVLRLA